MPYTQEFARRAAEAVGDPSAYVAGLVAEAAVYAPLGALLERHEVLLCPTIAAHGLVAGDDYLERLVPVGDVQLPWTEVIMTLPFNVIGRVPVLAVPSGTDDLRPADGCPARRAHVRRRHGLPRRSGPRGGAGAVGRPDLAAAAVSRGAS